MKTNEMAASAKSDIASIDQDGCIDATQVEISEIALREELDICICRCEFN